MKHIFLVTSFLTVVLNAGFMDSVGDLVESTLSDDKLEVESSVTTVGTLKESSILDDMLDTAKETIGITAKKPKETSLLDDTLTAMKEVAGLESKKKDNGYFDDGIMGDMAGIISLEKGETFGLPSVFGLNKKKEKKVFGSTVLGNTILGDVKETGSTFYKGFKTTGESTELMSGMMYKSSKIYNEMFQIFDDSPFNVFEDEDENSILDVFEKGNNVMDIFD